MDIHSWLQATVDRQSPNPSSSPRHALLLFAHSPIHRRRQTKDSGRHDQHQGEDTYSSLHGTHARQRMSYHKGEVPVVSVGPSEILIDDAPPGHLASYERRPRRKTKPDHYDPDNKHQQHLRDHLKDRPQRRKKDLAQDGIRTRELLQAAHLQGAKGKRRLTLKPDVHAGFLRHGRSSAQILARGCGLPDLVFNEMKFLQKPADHQDHLQEKDRSLGESKKEEQRRQEEVRISTYFQAVQPIHGTDISNGQRECSSAGRRIEGASQQSPSNRGHSSNGQNPAETPLERCIQPTRQTVIRDASPQGRRSQSSVPSLLRTASLPQVASPAEPGNRQVEGLVHEALFVSERGSHYPTPSATFGRLRDTRAKQSLSMTHKHADKFKPNSLTTESHKKDIAGDKLSSREDKEQAPGPAREQCAQKATENDNYVTSDILKVTPRPVYNDKIGRLEAFPSSVDDLLLYAQEAMRQRQVSPHGHQLRENQGLSVDHPELVYDGRHLSFLRKRGLCPVNSVTLRRTQSPAIESLCPPNRAAIESRSRNAGMYEEQMFGAIAQDECVVEPSILTTQDEPTWWHGESMLEPTPSEMSPLLESPTFCDHGCTSSDGLENEAVDIGLEGFWKPNKLY